MTIVITGDVNEFFDHALGDALASRSVVASRGVRDYLVGLLVGFARAGATRASTLTRPVSFLLNDALQAPAGERLAKLREVGDGSLYVTGFFREHLDAKGIDAAYVERVGATAYAAAGRLLRGGEATFDLFGELSASFQGLVRVFGEVADAFFAGGARGDEAVVKVYERWQRTGSTRLAEALVARGLMPIKGMGGVQ